MTLTQALKTLVYMNNSASYQASYPILAKEDSQLPQGLYGCNLTDCKSTSRKLKTFNWAISTYYRPFRIHFGYGMQWKGAVTNTEANPILSVSGELIRKVPDLSVWLAAAQTYMGQSTE